MAQTPGTPSIDSILTAGGRSLQPGGSRGVSGSVQEDLEFEELLNSTGAPSSTQPFSARARAGHNESQPFSASARAGDSEDHSSRSASTLGPPTPAFDPVAVRALLNRSAAMRRAARAPAPVHSNVSKRPAPAPYRARRASSAPVAARRGEPADIEDGPLTIFPAGTPRPHRIVGDTPRGRSSNTIDTPRGPRSNTSQERAEEEWTSEGEAISVDMDFTGQPEEASEPNWHPLISQCEATCGQECHLRSHLQRGVLPSGSSGAVPIPASSTPMPPRSQDFDVEMDSTPAPQEWHHSPSSVRIAESTHSVRMANSPMDMDDMLVSPSTVDDEAVEPSAPSGLGRPPPYPSLRWTPRSAASDHSSAEVFPEHCPPTCSCRTEMYQLHDHLQRSLTDWSGNFDWVVEQQRQELEALRHRVQTLEMRARGRTPETEGRWPEPVPARAPSQGHSRPSGPVTRGGRAVTLSPVLDDRQAIQRDSAWAASPHLHLPEATTPPPRSSPTAQDLLVTPAGARPPLATWGATGARSQSRSMGTYVGSAPAISQPGPGRIIGAFGGGGGGSNGPNGPSIVTLASSTADLLMMQAARQVKTPYLKEAPTPDEWATFKKDWDRWLPYQVRGIEPSDPLWDPILLDLLMARVHHSWGKVVQSQRDKAPDLTFGQVWSRLESRLLFDTPAAAMKSWEGLRVTLDNRGHLSLKNWQSFLDRFDELRARVDDYTPGQEAQLLRDALPKFWLDRLQKQEKKNLGNRTLFKVRVPGADMEAVARALEAQVGPWDALEIQSNCLLWTCRGQDQADQLSSLAGGHIGRFQLDICLAANRMAADQIRTWIERELLKDVQFEASKMDSRENRSRSGGQGHSQSSKRSVSAVASDPAPAPTAIAPVQYSGGKGMPKQAPPIQGKGKGGKDKAPSHTDHAHGRGAPVSRVPEGAQVRAMDSSKDAPLTFREYLKRHSPGHGCYTCYKQGRRHEHDHRTCPQYATWKSQVQQSAAKGDRGVLRSLRALQMQDNWAQGAPLERGVKDVQLPEAPRS